MNALHCESGFTTIVNQDSLAASKESHGRYHAPD